jgi:hypothetical protein
MDTTLHRNDPAAIDALLRRDFPAARTGDRDAYGRIVGACQNTVTAIALAIVRDVPSSEDIAQDAFLSAWTAPAPPAEPRQLPARGCGRSPATSPGIISAQDARPVPGRRRRRGHRGGRRSRPVALHA